MRSQLAALEAADLIRLAQAHPEFEYRFRHALVQEAAYDSLLRHNRRMLHLTTGEVLERLCADRLDELAPVLGNHFDEGEDYTRAVRYFTRAGDRAARGYANVEAEQHYRRALELARTHRPAADGLALCDLFLKLGRTIELTGRYDDALAHYADMQSFAQAQDDRRLVLAALIARSTIHSAPTLRFDPALAQSLSAQAIRIARELGDEAAEARLLWHASLVNKFLAQWGEHVRIGEQAEQIARRLGDRDLLAYVLNDIGEGLATVGQSERSFAALEEAYGHWLAQDNLPMLIDNRINLAYVDFVLGRLEPAGVLAREASERSARTHNLWGTVYAAVVSGYVERERGDWSNAFTALEEALSLGKQSGFGLALWFAPTMLSLLCLDMGDPKRALGYARLGDVNVTTGFVYAAGFLSAASMQAHVLLGDIASAAAMQDRVSEYLTVDEFYTRTHAALAISEFALSRGDAQRALAVMDETVDALRAPGYLVSLPWALFQKARALLSLARAAEAERALREARRMATTALQRPVLWRILLALSTMAAQRGDTAKAHALRDEARGFVDYMTAHAPAPALRASFLSRSDVRELLGHSGVTT